METSPLLTAALGGALIGIGGLGLLITHGRIAGVSGIVSRTIWSGAGPRGDGLAFLVGMLAAGAALSALSPAVVANATHTSVPLVALAGLLVGYGSRLGAGCTSGHGFCGVGRLAPRSLVATTLFALVGGVSLLVTRALGGAS
jgi:uncharacterized membrane protein YedE/YeeE